MEKPNILYEDKQILVVEKEEDVCCGTSKANSAIVHAGYDCKPGTMMARIAEVQEQYRNLLFDWAKEFIGYFGLNRRK